MTDPASARISGERQAQPTTPDRLVAPLVLSHFGTLGIAAILGFLAIRLLGMVEPPPGSGATIVVTALLVLAVVAFGWSWLAIRRWRPRTTTPDADRQALADQAAERRYRALTENSVDLAMIIDGDLRLRFLSAAVGGVLARDGDELLDQDLRSIVHADDLDELARLVERAPDAEGVEPARCELRVRRGDGAWRTVEMSAHRHHGDDASGEIILNAHDVTDRVEAQKRAQELLRVELDQTAALRHQAEHDALTGLCNRAAFQRLVADAVAGSDRVSVVTLDLDGFKEINDGRGHQAGDRVLGRLATRIVDAVRDDDDVARIGGDEFAVLVRNAGSERLDRLAERLLLAVAAPMADESGLVELSASVGIAGPDFDAADAESILADADLAMYQTKRSGGNGITRFHTRLRDDFIARVELKAEIERAVVDDQFELVYQPLWELETGRITAAEALVRWRHPTRGLLTPDKFLPLAEESDLITRIDTLVLREACRQAGEWAHSGDPALEILQVGVNISALDLSRIALVDLVTAELETNELDPSTLVLELTETAMMDNVEVAKGCLGELSQRGVRLALDDFGTGYSSLSQLKSLDFHVLKIDRAFVSSGDEATRSLSATIVALAQLLDLGVVAEGIETEEQLTEMRRLGCEYGQGYHLARPMPADELVRLARANAAAPRFAHELG